jgi:excisionase family DNA binding protein
MDGSTPTPQALLVDAREAARLLAISERKLWSLTNCGEIPCVRVGRAVRYPVDDLQRWIANQTRGGGTR